MGGGFDMSYRESYKRPGLSARNDNPWGHNRYPTITKEELAARRAMIPHDTRDLTGRLLGDPIPGDIRRQRA